MTKILVVEDERGIAVGLEDDLRAEGYDVEVVGDGVLASRRARDEDFDLILLDVMLPGRDGFEVCRDLRRAGLKTPVILLTAKVQEAEKILGLDLGADDYVTKPFSPRELRARIRAVLRRNGAAQPAEVYRFGDVEVDSVRGELRRAGTAIEITATEFKLLATFVRTWYGFSPGKGYWMKRGDATSSSPSGWWTTTSSVCARRSSANRRSAIPRERPRHGVQI